MNTKEYISSGILEAYLLGSLSPAAEAEVEANVAMYPELADELRNIEEALMQLASKTAIDPPAHLQDKIWDAIQGNAKNAGISSSETAPVAPKTIPLQPEYRKPMQWAYAAALALLVSIGFNVFLYSQNNSSKAEQTAMNTQLDTLKNSEQKYASLLSQYQQDKAMMADTGTQTIIMHTMLQGHPMAATLYWAKSKGDAYVAMNALPQPPKGMQYQLWVIQGGKPVSMGVLPNDMANTPAMQKVAMQVTGGEAFAISLEKEGGNPTPTAVYVLGKA